MWDLIVSVPDHCLSFYFAFGLAIYRCHAGLSCTSDEYPPVCMN